MLYDQRCNNRSNSSNNKNNNKRRSGSSNKDEAIKSMAINNHAYSCHTFLLPRWKRKRKSLVISAGSCGFWFSCSTWDTIISIKLHKHNNRLSMMPSKKKNQAGLNLRCFSTNLLNITRSKQPKEIKCCRKFERHAANAVNWEPNRRARGWG